MLSFLMVLYSTFLTRSGVLGDTSVHSFVDPGMWVYWLLITVLLIFIGLGAGLLLLRWKEIPREKVHFRATSREFALFLGALVLVGAALVITVGTSAPIITELLQGKKSAIDTSYYVKTTVPLGIAIGILAGVGQLLWWSRSSKEGLIKKLRLPLLLALLSTAILIALGVRGIRGGFFVFGSSLALFANLQVAWTIFKGNPKYMGGAIAHIGLGVMFFGFLASSQYDSKQTLSLAQGHPVDVMGYRLTYVGYHPVENNKYAFRVAIEKNGRNYQVAPIMYYSSYNDGLMRNPDILNLLTHDFYLAPLSLEQPSAEQQGEMEKTTFRTGETKKVGDLTITFLGFNMPDIHQVSMMEGKEVRIGARFSVARNGGPARIVEPAKLLKNGETSDVKDAFEGRYEFQITALSPDREARENSRVEIGILDRMKAAAGASAPDILVAEASIKPFINLVWAGLILVLLGFLVTIVRRTQEAVLKGTAASPGGLKAPRERLLPDAGAESEDELSP
jgi:cytochrome c-type biogenesis protein CcmF